MIDLFLVYKFIRKLVTPFKDWPAFKLGIIDDKGNILISRKKFTERKQREAFAVLDVMVLNIKKILAKIPGGQSNIGSYAAALWLIREWNHFSDGTLLTESVSDNQIEESVDIFYSRYANYITETNNVNSLFALNEKNIYEEPAVNVGSGNIAGLGVGPDGEPGLTKRQVKKKKLKDLMVRRLSNES